MVRKQSLKRARDFNLGEGDFDLALSLLIDACQSRLDIKYLHQPFTVRFYNQYFNLYLVRLYYFFMTINLLTILLEEPASVVVGGKPLPYYVPLMLNVLCEMYFFLRWLHIFTVADFRFMKKNKSFWASLIFICLMVIDDITYVIQHTTGQVDPMRWSRLLRPALLLTFPENKRIRAAFENIRRTAEDVISVFAMFVASLLFVSVVTLKLLDTRGMMSLDNAPYLPNFGEIAWELYVLTTTSNSPDVIIPAYEKHIAYMAIYVWVCVACNWLFMGILTASVYNAYKGHLREFVLSSLVKRKNILDQAFKILQRNDAVSRDLFVTLIQRVMPNRSEASIALIYDILDARQTGLSQVEFARLTEYMQLNFEEVVIGRRHFERYLPRFYTIYTSDWFQQLVRFIRCKPTRIFFDLMVVANGITLVMADGTPLEGYFEWIFTGIFTLEIALKYLASGGVNFFQEKWNIFDMAIVIGAFTGQLMNLILDLFEIRAPASVGQAFLLLRLFRLLKIVGQVPIFKCIINCIIIILPSLCAYATILLILFYIFACVGMELFGGLFVVPKGHNYTIENACRNHNLEGSSFLQLHYCGLNFNDAASSFATLFVLSVGNNWHILTDGFTRVTDKSYRLFFLFIHWMCVLLVLNIVLAFIIEAFLIEYDPQESRFEEFIGKRMREIHVDAETELRKRGLQNYRENNFYVTRAQLDKAFPPEKEDVPFSAFFFIPDSASIELLMFRMFEDEIEDIATNYQGTRSIRVNTIHF
ncbi:unnamed protein product [Mesocestoides corti]|uniref:Ion_trans domain-containing protein n=1 Tax=Mesocestoides corti TaxID=53468 RepID=A0A0R3UF06_MESCO|nr:unnamed protein product [Mesocestoides corti]